MIFLSGLIAYFLASVLRVSKYGDQHAVPTALLGISGVIAMLVSVGILIARFMP